MVMLPASALPRRPVAQEPAVVGLAQRPGPLERTALELDHAMRVAAFRRQREGESRRRIHESDAVLELIEECRLRGYAVLPTPLWAHVVRLVGSIDPLLRDELGINRRPDHVSDILFAAQDRLLREQTVERRRGPAPIIPLFGPRSENVQADG